MNEDSRVINQENPDNNLVPNETSENLKKGGYKKVILVSTILCLLVLSIGYVYLEQKTKSNEESRTDIDSTIEQSSEINTTDKERPFGEISENQSMEQNNEQLESDHGVTPIY